MKCPVTVQFCLCHDCKCSDYYPNFPNSDFCENESEKSCDMFDLLAHNISTCTPVKTTSKLKKLPTTYRNDFCRRIQLHSPTKSILPHPAIHIPNQKMYCGTSHKSDFKPYKGKESEASRGKIVHHKDNHTCSKEKFEGKSEAKSSFSYPIPKKVFGPNAASEKLFKVYPTSTHKNRQNVKATDFSVYKSSYKRPKELPKTNVYKPTQNIVLKLEPPFKHTSQYQDDFKRPAQAKRENIKKCSVYHPPSIPMENKTTYKTAFHYKIPEESKRKKWDPNHRIYKTAAGQCVYSSQEPLKNGQYNTLCCCFHKENKSPLFIECNITENCQCYDRGDIASGKICRSKKNSECHNKSGKIAGKNEHIHNRQMNLHDI